MRPRTLRIFAACLVGLALTLTGLPARAQTEPRPRLGDHQFVSTDLVPDAFVRTYFRTDVGYALTSEIHYPPLVVAGDTLVTLNGDLAYAVLDAEYQQKLRDWIAFRLQVGLRSRLGTRLASLISEGVTLTSGYELGWLARLHESRKTSLCGSLTVTNQTITIMDVRQFAEDVANRVPDARLIDNVPTVRSNAGLRFAWAISRPFGLTADASGSYGESPRRREADTWEYDAGASVDFDGKAAWNIPLGLALAYRQNSLATWSTSDHQNSSQTVLRIAYNGKPDFLIAVDVLGVFNRENSRAAPVWAGGASLSMRYYF